MIPIIIMVDEGDSRPIDFLNLRGGSGASGCDKTESTVGRDVDQFNVSSLRIVITCSQQKWNQAQPSHGLFRPASTLSWAS